MNIFFKVDYNKSYEPREEEMRKEIFMHNLRHILAQNLKQTTGLYSSFQIGVNQFADMTFDEFLKINTEHGGRDKLLEQNFNASVIHDYRFSDPDNHTHFDWRDRGAVTSVKNQGLCGCCYAFAAVSAVESNIFIQTGKLHDLSEQEIVDCAKGYFTAGCYGGYEIGALNYIQNNGDIALEESYPYKAKQEKCKRSTNDLPKVKVTIKRILQPPRENELELKKALIQYGPIIISIDHLHESFMRYKSGIYHESDCKKQFSHAALLVGFGTDKGEDYWLVKNSFGTTWGEDGYFRIARNRKNNCEIATEPVIISDRED
jgi:cathepsin L